MVLDADRPTVEDDPLFRIANYVVFSSECLRATTGEDDLGAALLRIAPRTPAFLAVSDGPNPVRYIADGAGADAAGRSRSRRSTRWRPATSFTPGSRWRSPRAAIAVAALRFGAAAAGAQMHPVRRQHGRAVAAPR